MNVKARGQEGPQRVGTQDLAPEHHRPRGNRDEAKRLFKVAVAKAAELRDRSARFADLF